METHEGIQLSGPQLVQDTPMEEQVASSGEHDQPATDLTGGEVVEEASAVPVRRDQRLYLPKHAGWEAVIKQTWETEHCYAKSPGEDWFHLLAEGEIYIQRGAEKFCLTCALHLKILTRNRLFWEKGSRGPEDD